ncbi:MAG: helix-turn-helix domain-containing protein [Patescibacteria group bacterium]
MQEPRKHLLDLGLTDSEITVYLSMISGTRTARDLVKMTELKRPTVYYALGCLEKRGLISKTGLEGDKRFSLEPLQRLSTLAEEKASDARQLKKTVDDMVSSLESKSLSINSRPTVAFFEGRQAVKRVIMDMLYCKDLEINSVAPENNFFWQIGWEFVKLFVTERMRRGIKTKNLWDAHIDQKIIKQYYQPLSEVRILPKVMRGTFQTTVFLYDDKVLYVSSVQNSYCVLITSQEHKNTMQAWFDGLWSVSMPHRNTKV